MKRLFILLFVLPALAFADETNSSEAACRAHLKRLGAAVRAYRLIHESKTPAKLSDLYYEGLIEDLATFVCPATGHDVPARTEIDAKTDYTLESLPDTKDLIVREKSPGHADGKVLGVFADGTIKVLAAPESYGPGGIHAVRIGVVVIVVIVLAGLAAALWACARWMRQPTTQRKRSIAQALSQLRAVIGPRQEFVNTARHRWGQIAGKVAAAGRKLMRPFKSRPVNPHPVPAGQAVESRGVTCPSCKTVNSAPGKFCRSCGAALGVSQAAVPLPSAACRACGKPLKPGAKFCAACGLPVSR